MPLAKQSSVAILDENDTTNDYVKVFKAISQLFKKADSGPINSAKTSEFYALARGMGDEKLSKQEFMAHVTWDSLKACLPAQHMQRFQDQDGDGDCDMDDVWLQLDEDRSGSVTFDEFVSALLDRPTPDKEVFLVYMNDEGNISSEKVGDALRAMGHNPSDAEVMKIVNKFDANADKEIDPEEWAAIVKSMPAPNDAQVVEDIKAAFGVLSKCEPGSEATASVETAELEYVFTNLGAKLSPEDAETMVKVVDANGDKQVDYSEFLCMRGQVGASYQVKLD
jgi:calmodulin